MESRSRILVAAVAGSVVVVLALSSAVGTSAAAQVTTSATPAPPSSAQCVQALGLACYRPQQLQRAYNLRALYAKGFNGKGSTIVIVDPFGSPTIGNDLHVFDQQLGLPDPPAFRVLQPVGPVPPFDRTDAEMRAKAGETTLDVEWSHAIAPGADIVLVETPVAETEAGGGFQAMLAAERYVIKHHLGDVISQSFSLPEPNFRGPNAISRLRKTYVQAERAGITVLGATNDQGVTGPTPAGNLYTRRVVQWPATDPLVTAVGGTELSLNAAGVRTRPDVAWNDTWDPALQRADDNVPPPVPWSTSGGVSSVFARPAYQNSVRRIVGAKRGVPDISMSASLSGAVLSFSSYLGQPAWGPVGGTSEATPEFAGIVAIAAQYARKRFGKQRLGLINPALYRLARQRGAGIVDVTSGNNTVSFRTGNGTQITTVAGYSARKGYNLVTGLGTIDAARLIPALARLG